MAGEETLTDRLSKERRSLVMSRIQGGLAKNSLERRVHNWLNAVHIRHEMNPKVQGHPDVRIKTPRGELFIFIDGCFWHVCPLHYTRPKTRQEFWIPHVEGSNRKREASRARLPYLWLRVWEHEINDGSYKRIIKLAIERMPARPQSERATYFSV